MCIRDRHYDEVVAKQMKEILRENFIVCKPDEVVEAICEAMPPEFRLPIRYLHKYLPYFHGTHTCSLFPVI